MDPPKPKELRKNRIRRRKQFKHVKKHVIPKQSTLASEAQTINTSDIPCGSKDDNDNANESEVGLDSTASDCLSLIDHDYVVPSPSSRPSSSLSRPGSCLSRPSSSLGQSNISGTLSVSLSDLSVSKEGDVGCIHVFSPASAAPTNFWNVEPNNDSTNKPQASGCPANEPSSQKPVLCEPFSNEPLSVEPLSTEPTSNEPTSNNPEESSKCLFLEARNKPFATLPENFLPVVDHEALHV